MTIRNGLTRRSPSQKDELDTKSEFRGLGGPSEATSVTEYSLRTRESGSETKIPALLPLLSWVNTNRFSTEVIRTGAISGGRSRRSWVQVASIRSCIHGLANFIRQSECVREHAYHPETDFIGSA